MPVAKRSFVVSLAAIYRINTELVDVEPQRSVMVRRRIDTRIPSPALSERARQARGLVWRSGKSACPRAQVCCGSGIGQRVGQHYSIHLGQGSHRKCDSGEQGVCADVVGAYEWQGDAERAESGSDA